MRQAQLSRFPLCAACKHQGLIRAASVVDHVWPWRTIGLEAFRVNRLQSLCPDCHSVKTGLEQKGIAREYGVRDWGLADYRGQMGQD
jgi:5-methylcytosine-specific restriction endonuclease McrA